MLHIFPFSSSVNGNGTAHAGSVLPSKEENATSTAVPPTIKETKTKVSFI